MYTNAQYTNPENTSIRCDINGVTSYVPVAPGNADYATIMALVADGGLVIAPYVSPPPAPVTQVTMRQARLALLAAGLLDNVELAVAGADRAVQIEWEYATVVERTSPLVEAIGSGLGMDAEAIDNLFADAATR
jgi:hypothetical protein